ncbi:ATP-binding protein [Allofustis seminis]|uniref:ATP-binding protein n=1 Tax=Allofustis seminis TaxID=166939 RepID=UPI0003723A45|nr:AAA family ATPase [Allofustis seminis]
MKIKKIAIEQFGIYRHKTFRLSPFLNIFLGENGAGKSTLMAFIHQIFYEFPKRNQKNNYQIQGANGYMGGYLIVDLPEIGEVKIQRISGPKAVTGQLIVTLIEENQPLEPAEYYLTKALAHLKQEELRALYTFNLDDLQALKAMSRSDLNEYFQSLTVEGSQHLFDRIRQLDKEAGTFYKKTGRLPELNQKLIEYEKIKAHTQEIAKNNEQYVIFQAEKEQLEQQLQDIKEQQKDLKKSLEILEYKKTDRVLATEINQLLSDSEALDLPEDATLDKIDNWYIHYQKIAQLKQMLASSERSDANKIKREMPPKWIIDYYNNRPLWEAYILHHAQAQSLATQLKQVDEKMANSKEQFYFFYGDSDQTEDVSPLAIALPDTLTEEQLEKAKVATATRNTLESRKEVLQQKIENEQSVAQMKEKWLIEKQKTAKGAGIDHKSQKQHKIAAILLLCVITICFLLYLMTPVSFQKIALIGAGSLLGLLGLWRWHHVFSKMIDEEGVHVENVADIHQPIIDAPSSGTIQALQQQLEIISKELDQTHQILNELFIRAGWSTNAIDWEFSAIEKEQLRLKKLQMLQYRLQKCSKQFEDLSNQLERLQRPVVILFSDNMSITPLELQRAIDHYLQTVEAYEREHAHEKKIQEATAWRKNELEKELHHEEAIFFEKFGEWSELSPEIVTMWQQNLVKKEQISQHVQLLKTQMKDPDIFDNLPSEIVLQRQEVHIIKQLESLGQDIERLQQQIADKKATMHLLSSSDAYERAIQEQEYFEAEMADIVDEWLSIQMSRYILEETLAQNMNVSFLNMQENINKYFKFLTDNYYVQVKWTTEGLQVMDHSNRVYSIERLSRGTYEQLYVAIRLAFIDEVGDRFEFPLLIDDAFVNFDSQRRHRMYELLMQYSQHHQVIYFTFDAKVVDYVSEMNSKIFRLGAK